MQLPEDRCRNLDIEKRGGGKLPKRRAGEAKGRNLGKQEKESSGTKEPGWKLIKYARESRAGWIIDRFLRGKYWLRWSNIA